MIVLGIETSCDETSVAILNNRRILANLVFSQEHNKFKGVVPEIAARAHVKILPQLLSRVLDDASIINKIEWKDIDLVAATAGPGLIGGVMTGCTCGKSIALTLNKPYVGVNHLAGHALTARLTHEVNFPYLLLLVSGGHTQLLIAKNVDDFELLGTTLDDAVGEAFDKSAKMIGLPYPGGPYIEKLAKKGNPYAFKLPEPLFRQKESLDFSFSGLKTAVRRVIDDNNIDNDKFRFDISASLQHTIKNILAKKIDRALKKTNLNQVVIAGGVASNCSIRDEINLICMKNKAKLICPPINLCTDNAAMIAWAGLEEFKKNGATDIRSEPLARWPLASLRSNC